LSVPNGARAVEFCKSAFGATELFRFEDPGKGVVAGLSMDGAEFWLSHESPEHGNISPRSLGGGSARVILTVADRDAMFQRALAARKYFRWARSTAGDCVAWSILSGTTSRFVASFSPKNRYQPRLLYSR
jgi:uncharacterized glyoxalase superfamily protein PhnB